MAGGCALARSLKINSTLKKLVILSTTSLCLDALPFQVLSDNSIGSTGAIAFAEALMHNRTLQTLSLNGNNIRY